MTFKEKYQAGEIEFEAIDDYVDEWNNSDDERTLAKFLGLNADEEDAWIDDGDEVLKEIARVAGIDEKTLTDPEQPGILLIQSGNISTDTLTDM